MTDDLPTHDAAPVKNPTEARQGRRGLRVLFVLIGGLILALGVLLYLVSTGIENPPPAIGQQAPVGPSTDAVPNNAEPSRLDNSPPPAQ